MWPFKSRKLTHHTAQKALGVAGVAAPEGTSSVVIKPKPNHFSVETHVNTIRGMLEALETQIATAEKDCTAEVLQHEKNQSAEIERHSLAMSRILTKQSELETLQQTYTAALKIAAPGGDDGYVGSEANPAPGEALGAPKKPRRPRKAPAGAKPPRKPTTGPIPPDQL